LTAVDALASRLGIEESFRDATSQLRKTSPATKRALLAAMGFPIKTEAQAARALFELKQREWSRSLPPVAVIFRSRYAIAVEVNVPADTSCLEWRLELEDGSKRVGSANFAKRKPIARYDLRGRKLARHQLTLGRNTPDGYHRLRTNLDGSLCSLIVTPGRCWLPAAAKDGRRLWGVAAQLYLLRSKRNWGIGDFTDLRQLIRLVEDRGGNVVGLNPLHAMFLDNPEHASPYSPETRLLLNVLNIDVESVPELADSAGTRQLIASEKFQQRLQKCRAANLVDYAGVAELKLQALKSLFEYCRSAPGRKRWKQFESFRRRAAKPVEQSCLFEVLRQHFAEKDKAQADWHSWPSDFRDPSSPAVARFADEHATDVAFHAWMQWLADNQLGAAARTAKKMEVGIYRDLAVGTDDSGSATWSNPEGVVSGAHVGAPPDVFNPAGQDWGLPPLNPRTLFESAYENFIQLIRANMRHAGGLRIDHVMALQHLYWVPKGKSPRDGAYLKYPLEDLVGIIALESQRKGCLVVGEDLGTVPDGFRERMQQANILSYRVLFFEQNMKTGAFSPPKEYPRLAVAVTGSHDLPTVSGWWNETDIAIKEVLQLLPAADGPAEARRQRERDQRALVKALRNARLLPATDPVQLEDLITAVHAYLASTGSLIALVQLDDISAETDPVNVPATTDDEHPNWRRRLSARMENLAKYPRFDRLARIFEAERARRRTRTS
jgi:4-alpha-glucanotransferase